LKSLTDERFKKYKLLINKPKANDGLGRMIIQIIDDFTTKHTHKAVSVPFMNLSDLSSAIKYCSAVIGNNSDSIVIAPRFKAPVINIGKKDKRYCKKLQQGRYFPKSLLSA